MILSLYWYRGGGGMSIFEPESLAIFAGSISDALETGGYTFYCTAQRMLLQFLG